MGESHHPGGARDHALAGALPGGHAQRGLPALQRGPVGDHAECAAAGVFFFWGGGWLARPCSGGPCFFWGGGGASRPVVPMFFWGGQASQAVVRPGGGGGAG